MADGEIADRMKTEAEMMKARAKLLGPKPEIDRNDLIIAHQSESEMRNLLNPKNKNPDGNEEAAL